MDSIYYIQTMLEDAVISVMRAIEKFIQFHLKVPARRKQGIFIGEIIVKQTTFPKYITNSCLWVGKVLYSDQQTKPHLPARNVMKIIIRKEKKELEMKGQRNLNLFASMGGEGEENSCLKKHIQNHRSFGDRRGGVGT